MIIYVVMIQRLKIVLDAMLTHQIKPPIIMVNYKDTPVILLGALVKVLIIVIQIQILILFVHG